ncbi:MAG: hypothetical protein A2048_01005 [Deltaproteobacteria bacterium GWA2_45_12]|nr:MAG: hypothetical protein A2048_01005 [Deltaproteobacteria bacterium GWA2_45_12]
MDKKLERTKLLYTSLSAPMIILLGCAYGVLPTGCAEAVIPNPPPAPPTLSIQPNNLVFIAPDFNGEAPYYTHTESITLRNIGEEVLTITNITMDDLSGATCGFSFDANVNNADSPTRCSNPPLDRNFPIELEAQQSTSLDVTYTQDNYGSFSTSIVIESNDPEIRTSRINITSENSGLGQAENPLVPAPAPEAGSPEITVSPLSIAFVSIPTGRSATRIVTLRNEGNGPLHINNIALAAPAAPAADGSNQYQLAGLPPFPFELAAGVGIEYSFQINYRPNAVGNHQTSIVISSDDVDEATVTIPVTGNARMNTGPQ